MMRNIAIRSAVLTALSSEGAEAGGTPATTTDGTMVTDAIKQTASKIIHSALEVHEQLVSVSGQLLNMAKQCVKEAKGDNKRALAMFTSALADAESTLLGEAKTKAERAKVEDFLDEKGSWKTYVRNISSGLKLGVNLKDIKSESALRRVCAEVRKAQRGGAGGTGDQTPEQRAEAEMKRLESIAGIVATRHIDGAEEESAKIKGAVALLLKAVKVVPWQESNNEDRVVNAITQATAAIRRMIPADVDTEETDKDAGTATDRHTAPRQVQPQA